MITYNWFECVTVELNFKQNSHPKLQEQTVHYEIYLTVRQWMNWLYKSAHNSDPDDTNLARRWDDVIVTIAMQILWINLPQQTLYLLLNLPLAVDGQSDDSCTEQEHGQCGCSNHTCLLLVTLTPLMFKSTAGLIVRLATTGPVNVTVEVWVRVRVRIRLVKTVWFVFLKINIVVMPAKPTHKPPNTRFPFSESLAQSKCI